MPLSTLVRRPWRPVSPFFALALAATGCGGAHAPTTALKFDSATNVALDGVLDATVITDSDADAAVDGQIREQLQYAIGQLNGLGGGIDTTHAAVVIGAKSALPDGRFQVAYQARALVSWPREYAVPAAYTLTLPARGDAAGRRDFLAAFGADEDQGKRCLSDDAHAVGTGSFWYYMRPYKPGCPLATEASPLATRASLKLALSAANTSGKSPEYGQVWADGKLVITAVFAKYDEGATSGADAGIAAYTQAYDTFLAWFGAPVSSTLPAGQRPSAAQADIRLVFNTAQGPMQVALLLVDSVTSAGPDFIAKYEALTETSDFISYDGHSGLGANIRALTRLGRFAADQYQIFLLNGCDSFSYVDDRLSAAHQAVNAGAGPDKYLDVITNARPAQFGEMPRATLSVAYALVEKKRTYRQILAMFDGSQRANVHGEQDNRWPESFGGH